MKRKPTQGALKIAISLPRSLYVAVERARVRQGQNRSEFFRGAVEAVTARLDAAARKSNRQAVQALLRSAGAIPAEDVEEMRQAIEEGCERIDARDW